MSIYFSVKSQFKVAILKNKLSRRMVEYWYCKMTKCKLKLLLFIYHISSSCDECGFDKIQGGLNIVSTSHKKLRLKEKCINNFSISYISPANFHILFGRKSPL